MKKLTMVDSYSSTDAPCAFAMIPCLERSNTRLSVGSPSLRVSHQSTCPSVDAEKHSVPVLELNQITLYGGSRWLTWSKIIQCSRYVTIFYPSSFQYFLTPSQIWTPHQAWMQLNRWTEENLHCHYLDEMKKKYEQISWKSISFGRCK